LQFVRDSHAGANGLDRVQWLMAAVLATIIVHLAARQAEIRGAFAAREIGTGSLAAVCAAIVAAAIIASPFLSPLETAVVFLAALGPTLVVIMRIRAELGRIAPAGTMAVLILQQVPNADPAARKYFEFGYGRTSSDFTYHGYKAGPDTTPDDCSSPPAVLDYTRRHKVMIDMFTAGFRVDSNRARGMGIHVQAFHGQDRMSPAEVRVGSVDKPYGHAEGLYGAAVAVDADAKWGGFTAGFAGGSWPSMTDEQVGNAGPNVVPIIGFRVGLLSYAYFEGMRRSGDWSGIESPAASFTAVIRDKREDRIRISSKLVEISAALPSNLYVTAMATGGSRRAWKMMMQRRLEFGRP
jgi:hypothetical protein